MLWLMLVMLLPSQWAVSGLLLLLMLMAMMVVVIVGWGRR